jgi:hypothetical protein
VAQVVRQRVGPGDAAADQQPPREPVISGAGVGQGRNRPVVEAWTFDNERVPGPRRRRECRSAVRISADTCPGPSGPRQVSGAVGRWNASDGGVPPAMGCLRVAGGTRDRGPGPDRHAEVCRWSNLSYRTCEVGQQPRAALPVPAQAVRPGCGSIVGWCRFRRCTAGCRRRRRCWS